jgi:Protein of unknown function (DUF3159)
VVYGAARTADRDDRELTAPSFRSVALRGLPGFLREAFVPLGAFYAGYRLSGITAGIGASVAGSALVYLYERRAGRDGLLVRIALAWVIVRAVAGLLAHSATVYLGAPVLANALWGFAFLASIAIGRPLAGALACAWYPFPREYRRTAQFRRVFGIESAVWGVYLLAISGVRLAVLLQGSIGSFVLVSVLAGTPATIALMAWSIWYATRKLS